MLSTMPWVGVGTGVGMTGVPPWPGVGKGVGVPGVGEGVIFPSPPSPSPESFTFGISDSEEGTRMPAANRVWSRVYEPVGM